MSKRLWAICLTIGLAVSGCGTPDVTGESVEDAMKEREAKARALDAKQGVKSDDHSAEMQQDPQLGGK